MTTLTIRIDERLKKRAAAEAARLNIPLTLVIVNTLQNFVDSPKIVIGEPEVMEVTPALQKKMDRIGEQLANI